MKGAALLLRKGAWLWDPALLCGMEQTDTSLHPSPVRLGCIRGADGQERYEAGAKARGRSKHHQQTSSLMTHLFT